MSVLDSGGFDLLVTISEPTVSTAARAAFGGTMFPPRAISTPALVGTLTPAVRIVGATLPGGTDITVTIDLTGTTLRVTRAALMGPLRDVPPHLADVAIAGTVAVTGRLVQTGTGGTTVVADFMRGGGYPIVVPSLDDDATLASPLVMFVLAAVAIANPGDPAAVDAARQDILAMVRQQVIAAVTDAVSTIRVVVAAPPGGLPVTALTLMETPRVALTLAYTVGGGGGSTASIRRLNLLTAAGTGVPIDRVVLTLANGGLFRDLLRPLATGALGLTASGFLPGIPFAWLGAVPLVPAAALPPGIASITLTSLVAGIDNTGLVRLIGSVSVAGSGGVFSLNASVNQAFAIGATAAAGGFTLTATPVGTARVTTDVSIPAWVYAVGFLTGNALLVAVLATIDLISSSTLITAPLGRAITGAIGAGLTFPVPLSPGLPPITPVAVNSVQPDSATRFTVVGGFTVAFPFRDHDVIINFR